MNKKVKLYFNAKENGVFCGEEVIRTGFAILDPNVVVDMEVRDGDSD